MSGDDWDAAWEYAYKQLLIWVTDLEAFYKSNNLGYTVLFKEKMDKFKELLDKEIGSELW